MPGIFITELKSKKEIEIPVDVINSLGLEEGDKVEVLVKKIKSRRLEIKISRNPLSKILDLKP